MRGRGVRVEAEVALQAQIFAERVLAPPAHNERHDRGLANVRGPLGRMSSVGASEVVTAKPF